MTKTGPNPQSPKGYSPSEGMQKLIADKLQFLKKGESSGAWTTQKSRILDKLFQSTADLVFFLEQVADNPKLQEIFEDDLKELFEARPERETKQLSPLFGAEQGGIRIQETLFSRLVFAVLIPHEEDYENFRVRLLDDLQSIVYAKMWYMLTQRFDMFDIITKSATEDLKKALGWTQFQSKAIHDYIDEPNRFFSFSAPKYRMQKIKKK